LCTVFELRFEFMRELCSNLGFCKPQVRCRGLCTVFELRFELPLELCSNLGFCKPQVWCRGVCTVFELRFELPLELCSNLGLGPSPRFGVGVCAPCLSCAQTLLEFGVWPKPQVWCRGLCTVFELRFEIPLELCSNLGLGPSPRFGVGVCAPCLSCVLKSRSNSARIWGLAQALGLCLDLYV
jgi:hypothetical protein